MRVLFVTGGGQATVFALAPLATAVRAAGHQVFMAANHEVMPAITASALPAVPVTESSLRHFISHDRQGRPVDLPLGRPVAEQGEFTGRWFARMAAESLPLLRDFTARWRPDLVVGGTSTYAAALLARHLGVPYVRLAWDAIDARHVHPGASRELGPELALLGLDVLPEPDLFIDVCPPGLRPREAAPAEPMRFVLGNLHRVLEPWMYTRGEHRRVCVTAGSQVTRAGGHGLFEFLTRTVRELAPLDAEVLVAAPQALVEDVRSECRDVGRLQAGWMPLDVVAPTCDLLVHHGGGVTGLTGMCAGVPQVVVPGADMLADAARRLAAYGAAVTLPTGDGRPGAVGEAARQVLSDRSHAVRAGELRAEIEAMPTPHDLVAALEKLARV
ncbi:nucleotide disphospho-sugar-binding domain-containing protein [Streptomyces sp. NPDC048142]|uniref:nucleotide disphospho-sugar-binding domain-containing protein n=1 Tax=Streptomyces sp. NPDC048142 TaxID=3365501 RepID=UPI0037209261